MINFPGKERYDASDLRQLVEVLRGEGGCPWDREQTHESLKPEVVEEAAEVVCGINILEATGRAENLKEELGDLLMQVVMHAQIAEEEGLFTLEDVIRGINEKMIRRHPHVFGGKRPEESRKTGTKIPEEAGTSSGSETAAEREALLLTWKEIKQQEKAGREWEDSYLREAFRETEELLAKEGVEVEIFVPGCK